jgi:hypothetical protein
MQTVWATNEPMKQVVLASPKLLRVEKPEVALQEPLPRWLEPISMPVKKVLAVDHKDSLPVLGGSSEDRRTLSRKAGEEQERENRQFRGLDKVLKLVQCRPNRG